MAHEPHTQHMRCGPAVLSSQLALPADTAAKYASRDSVDDSAARSRAALGESRIIRNVLESPPLICDIRLYSDSVR